MFSILRHHTLLTITLLALLSQLLLANGLMIPNAMADEMPMMSMQHEAECHPMQMQSNPHCCGSHDTMQMQRDNTNHCCNSTGSCISDCHHCLVISVIGTVFSVFSWPKRNTNETLTATPMHHFHSISLPQVLRPPIA